MLVAGIGSPHGDDTVGWVVVDELEAAKQGSVRLMKARYPADLLDELEGCDQLLAIDACRCGLAYGTLLRLEWPDDALLLPDSASTHGFGLESTLKLAESLGVLPAKTILLLAEVGDCELDAVASRERKRLYSWLANAAEIEIDEAVNARTIARPGAYQPDRTARRGEW